MKAKNRYILIAVSLILLGVLVYTFSEIVTYVLISWVLSMIGAPVVKFLRKYVGKNIASVATLGLFIVLFTVLLSIFIPPLTQQAKNLASIDYNNLIENLEEPISDWENWLAERGMLAQVDSEKDSLRGKETDPNKVYIETLNLDSPLGNAGISDTLSQKDNITIVVNVINEDHRHNAAGQSTTGDDEHEHFFDQLRQNLFSFFNPDRITKLFSSVLGKFGSILMGIASVLFIAFFFLREQGLFNDMISSIIPDEYTSESSHALDETSKLLIRYFTGVLTQMTLITIFVSLLLTILGVKNALLIGFFAALMNVIPYIGPIIGAGFAIIITVSSNLDLSFYDEMLPLLLKVLGVFGVMQVLDNFILQPQIFSKSVKAHPLEIFIVVLIGAKLGGIGGMVLAIPLYTVLRVVAKVFLSEFKVVQRITRSL